MTRTEEEARLKALAEAALVDMSPADYARFRAADLKRKLNLAFDAVCDVERAITKLFEDLQAAGQTELMRHYSAKFIALKSSEGLWAARNLLHELSTVAPTVPFLKPAPAG